MKTWVQLFISMILVLGASELCGLPQAWAALAKDRPQETLIVIGYSDDNHVENWTQLFTHQFFFNRAHYTEDRITETLMLADFTEDPHHPGRFENAKRNEAVTVLNSNVLCPGEDSVRSVRSSVCAAQTERSVGIQNHLEQNLLRYDRFIYIGHSRLGLGLGLGPFRGPESTFNLRLFNPVEAGRLKKVVIAACDSKKYYETNVTSRTSIQFVGTKGALLWPEDLLPLVLKELND